jgi:hypothetical protein
MTKSVGSPQYLRDASLRIYVNYLNKLKRDAWPRNQSSRFEQPVV